MSRLIDWLLQVRTADEIVREAVAELEELSSMQEQYAERRFAEAEHAEISARSARSDSERADYLAGRLASVLGEQT